MQYVNKLFFGLALTILLLLGACGENKQQKNEKAMAQTPAMDPRASNQAKEQQLCDAALVGNSSAVQKLISEKINVNAKILEGRNAMMLAAYNGHTNILKMLIEAGAAVDVRDDFGRTALMYASTGSFPDAVKLLLENGADPNVVDGPEKFSPLMFAAAEGHLDVVNVLLENKADHTLKDKDGDTAEIFARQNGHTKVADVLAMLK